ncbi:hypothetical protein [uncultured Sphingomonas sp.]|uniref:hypothetical protein n=1 Tax=uncultured Sphingomonas sp. TaxID=158754 RepID=UPI0035C9EF68
MIAASCGTTTTVQPFDEVPATVTPLAPATLAIEGRLHRRWGLRIATGDARVADVAGMEFSERHGLLAVTRGGQWLSFDLRGGTLAGIHAVGVAATRGAAGAPTSLVTVYGERTFVAFGGAHPVIARYALGACGAASTAVPWITVTGGGELIVVQGAYTYLGIVGRHAGDGGALVLPYARRAVALAGRNPLGASARTLVAASNPARIVPEIIVAHQAGHGGRTDVTLVPVDAWGDVQGGPARPQTPLATLPRAPSAMASQYDRRGKTTLVILAYPGPSTGTLDLYAFDTDVAL